MRHTDIIRARVQAAEAARVKYPVTHSILGPRTEVIFGDCRSVLPTLPVSPKLIFADPPFNIGQRYHSFTDKIPEADYLGFTEEWVWRAWELLKDGVLAIHVPDNVARMVIKLEGTLGLTPLAWYIMHYRFGEIQENNWVNSKCHLLIYSKGNYTWNSNSVLVDTDRATVYNDSRTDESGTPGKRVPLDVFGIPSDGQFWGRVPGNSAERWIISKGALVDHPNQLPEVYLERVIKAYTSRGDLVLDPFGGSGTTGTVSRALQRPSISIEAGELTAQSAFLRMKRGAIRVKMERFE